MLKIWLFAQFSSFCNLSSTNFHHFPINFPINFPSLLRDFPSFLRGINCPSPVAWLSGSAFSATFSSTPSGVKSGCRVVLTNSWNLRTSWNTYWVQKKRYVCISYHIILYILYMCVCFLVRMCVCVCNIIYIYIILKNNACQYSLDTEQGSQREQRERERPTSKGYRWMQLDIELL